MLRIKSLVKSQVTFIKGVSHVILFTRSIGCYNVTKVILAIRYRIKLYIIQKLKGAELLILLAFTYDAYWRLNLPNINDFLITLRHPSYYIIFKIVQRCLVWIK